MSQYLHGFHDAGGEHLHGDKPGWTVITEAIGCDPNDQTGRDYRHLSDRGITVIVRLNNGYHPGGTIPEAGRYVDFARRCANFVRASRGCTRWIIGNEPNHVQERPNGVPISAADYAACFNLCADAITDVSLEYTPILAAIAPWNTQTGDWLTYFREVIERAWFHAGGLALHTYTHGPDPSLITSEARMLPPFADRRFQFRAYQDFMAAIPAYFRSAPVYITETNQDAPWLDTNSGWVQAAYAEIDAWNQRADTQTIHCLCLYRWNRDDQWTIEPKAGIHADFRAAVTNGYTVAVRQVQTPSHIVNIPSIQAAPRLPALAMEWDERLTKRGIEVINPSAPVHVGTYWRLIKARYFDPQEGGGKVNVFVDLVDQAGQRVVGVPVRWMWSSGADMKTSEAKPGHDYALNFDMYAPGKSYSVQVADGTSDIVANLGLGTFEEPNVKHHVSYHLVFQRVAQAARQPDPVPPPQPVPAPVDDTRAQVPPLVHPVADGRYRTVTQVFGVRPEHYSQFKVDGVALKGHNGVDFGTPVGTPIGAVAAGEVVEVAYDPAGYGQYAKLRHRWGESLYAHLLGTDVLVGDRVEAGQLVGQSGNTGNSTGPHLHLGLRVNPFNRADGWGGYSDPLPYLQQGYATPAVKIPHLIAQQARIAGVDSNLLASLVWAESSFNPKAQSPVGAMGLCQLMPPTWAEWSAKVGATDPWQPDQNLAVGAAYWKWLRTSLGNDWSALCAWNFGIGNVLNGVKPPAETVEFANKVIHGADLLDALTQ